MSQTAKQPTFLKPLSLALPKSEPNVKSIKTALLDLSENKYNDGLTNLMAFSLSSLYGSEFLFTCSICKVKKYEQDFEITEVLDEGDMIGEGGEDQTGKPVKEKEVKQESTQPECTVFYRIKVLLNNKFFKSEHKSKTKARQDLVQKILNFYNTTFEHMDGPESASFINLSEIDCKFIERYILEKDDNYYNSEMDSTFLSELNEFCAKYCKSRPDLEIQYKEVELSDLSVKNVKDQYLNQRLNNNHSTSGPINIRLSIKSDNVAMTASGISVAAASNVAAMNIFKKSFQKDYFEYLEYKNSEVTFDKNSHHSTKNTQPAQYEKTLLEFTEWSNLQPPKYYKLDSYPGLLRSEINIIGHDESKNLAAFTAYNKVLEIFATGGDTNQMEQASNEQVVEQMEMQAANEMVEQAPMSPGVLAEMGVQSNEEVKPEIPAFTSEDYVSDHKMDIIQTAEASGSKEAQDMEMDDG